MIKCYSKKCSTEVSKKYTLCRKCKDKYYPGVKNNRGKRKLSILEIQNRLRAMGKKAGMYNEGKLFAERPKDV